MTYPRVLLGSAVALILLAAVLLSNRGAPVTQEQHEVNAQAVYTCYAQGFCFNPALAAYLSVEAQSHQR